MQFCRAHQTVSPYDDLTTVLFWEAVVSFAGLFDVFYYNDEDCFYYYKKQFSTLDRGSMRSNLGIKI